jgi:hypothetical protein
MPRGHVGGEEPYEHHRDSSEENRRYALRSETLQQISSKAAAPQRNRYTELMHVSKSRSATKVMSTSSGLPNGSRSCESPHQQVPVRMSGCG